MRRQARMQAGGELVIKREQILRPVHGLYRAETEPRQRGFAKNCCDQIGKIPYRSKVSAPPSEIDPGEDQLLAPAIEKMANVIKASLKRNRTARSARCRDHAEGAAATTAVLDFEIGPRLVCVRSKRQRSKFGVRKNLIYKNLRLRFCGLREPNKIMHARSNILRCL